ncbi:MAG TPA: nuclear transport factor 2 family protein, partial [Planctomycetota bacterium]|nr:nuclear transport factor 2 family protein [Planctomycetota bacterium]
AELAAAATAEALRAVASGELRAVLERYYADFSARDWPAFAGHFWPGATITTRWQPPGEGAPRVVVTSVPDFVAQAPQGPGSRSIFEERLTGAETRVEGGLAQVWARYAARFGDPGDVDEWTGIDAFTLMRHDGEWKIVALAFAHEEPR